jgi:hypothetical protein
MSPLVQKLGQLPINTETVEVEVSELEQSVQREQQYERRKLNLYF